MTSCKKLRKIKPVNIHVGMGGTGMHPTLIEELLTSDGC